MGALLLGWFVGTAIGAALAELVVWLLHLHGSSGFFVGLVFGGVCAPVVGVYADERWG